MTTLEDLSWVTQLAKRYANAAARQTGQTDADNGFQTLQLAANAVNKLQLDVNAPDNNSRHIVVLGPTQSGKSSLVNLLLDADAASISALAGFTVHAQGYTRTLDESCVKYVADFMAPLHRVAGATLDSSQLDYYVIETVETGSNALVNDDVIWDTPDFDSISARGYEQSVFKTAALADSVVMIVSKDKYGDKRVWNMLALLEELGKPFFVCINKLDLADEEVIRQAFSSRYQQAFESELPQLVLLPFIKSRNGSALTGASESTRATLDKALKAVSASIDSSTFEHNTRQLISKHEHTWLEPLAEQAHARTTWQRWIGEAIDDAETYYVSHYLENPDRYDTFNRALAALLGLLEIPGVAPALTRARSVVTWPARRLLGLGRSAIQGSLGHKDEAEKTPFEREQEVHQYMLDMTLTRLQSMLLQAPNEPVWRSLDSAMRAESSSIKQHYIAASAAAGLQFEPEVEKAAQQLHEKLQTQPALLNTLRAARASADAAGVALAVKSGGLAPTDLILAPAMLSVTTMLTESALGRYLDSVKNELKLRQQKHIRHKLLEQELKHRLHGLAENLQGSDIVISQLEPELQTRLDSYLKNHSRGVDNA